MRLNKFLPCIRLFIVLIFLSSVQNVYADHLKGGWIKYTYLGQANGKVSYHVSCYQYSDCSEAEKVDPEIYLGVFDAVTKVPFIPVTIRQTSLTREDKSNFGPCFQNPPTVCYLVAEYTADISLPVNAGGYVLSFQRCCRIIGIENIPSSNNVGITYTITIPGGNNSNNNSPVFSFNDTVAICFNAPFTFDFSATDIDNDSLVYSLCSGLAGGDPNNYVIKDPAAPPYQNIPYYFQFSGSTPLGTSVSIDPETGILSGIAPLQTGTYVVAVCIDEFRNGVYIGHTRKEIHLDVADCKLGGAELDPSYVSCDGFTFTFANKVSENPGYSYYWDFGITGSISDTSILFKPTFTYPDTGIYTVKLKADNNKGCQDSAAASISIFPGFIPNFSFNGSCIQNPYDFKDLTSTKYGFVDTWKWFFGENQGIDDSIQNPSYRYIDTGQKTIKFIVTNSKGCIDSVSKKLVVNNGPDLSTKFSDTLICNIDTLRLEASSSTPGATFNWLPAYNIIGANTNRPLVYPKQNFVYDVTVTDKGCTAAKSVAVNVTNQVTLNLPADTTICQTDEIPISSVTNALYFSWSPDPGLSSYTVEAPLAKPLSTTKYSLTASIGNCMAADDINIKVVPYPVAKAGLDAVICYGKTTLLDASIKGSAFTWSPEQTLYKFNTLTPVAGPTFTTEYILRVTDTLGCPKPVSDSVTVRVVPKVLAFAGNDTVVVRQQPLQLNAEGGTNYQWSPSTDLSNPFISNPVVRFTDGADTVLYNVRVSTPEGCFANDSIKIYIFETKPETFIPTAFTPNGDGKNDVFKPTVAGMKKFLYFRIYNRWGQLLFNTSELNKGWNGMYKGIKQPSGTYVFVVEAVKYNDNPYFKKGTFVLIR